MSDYIAQSEAAGRVLLPDLVRAVALIGIAVVNVGVFAYSIDETFYAGLYSTVDRVAVFLVNTLFAAKSYPLFSFMFGVGFAYQIQAAERRGVEFNNRYLRRLIALFVIGVFHAWAMFVGDILVAYALLGLLLLGMKDLSPKSLKTWAGWLIGVWVSLAVLFAVVLLLVASSGADFSDASGFAMMDEEMVSLFQTGSFFDISAVRLDIYTAVVTANLFTSGPIVGAFFILGLLAVRTGSIADPNHTVWAKARWLLLPTVAASAVLAWVSVQAESMMDPYALFAMLAMLAVAPFQAFAYRGWIAKWAARPHSGLRTFLARGGTATLTAYLFQSLVMSMVFCGYGLGLFNKLPASHAVVIALATAFLSISVMSLWRMRFSRGPLEEGLRRWTYLGAR